jgi:hypothetical protein
LELITTEVIVGELRNHATRRSGFHAFRTSLEARSELKQTALVPNIACFFPMATSIWHSPRPSQFTALPLQLLKAIDNIQTIEYW